MNRRDTDQHYTVKQVADLSGITVRTLHHYDQIALLQPASRSDKGYRLYTRDDLIRLQQILFYRELDVDLATIKDLLDDEDFNATETLERHRAQLVQRQSHMAQLIQTVDRTLAHLKGETTMPLNDKDLYQGFDQETIDLWNREVDEQYDPEVVAESRRNVGNMSKGQFQDVQKEGERVTAAISMQMDLGPEHPEVQSLIGQHHAWIENFYQCPAEMYKGLGQLYIQNPEFTAYYEKVKPGLAQFMSDAMAYYADHHLAP